MNDCRINPSDSESLSLDFIDALLEGGEKQCPKCGKIKPAGEFYKMIHRSTGRSPRCKECTKEARKRHYRCVKTPSCPRAGRLGAELRQWEAFLSAIYDSFGSTPWTVAELKARLDREVKEVTAFKIRITDCLPDDLGAAFSDPRRSFSHPLGRALARQDRRRFPSGLMIARGQTVNRAAQWVIVQTKETDPKLIDKEVP